MRRPPQTRQRRTRLAGTLQHARRRHRSGHVRTQADQVAQDMAADWHWETDVADRLVRVSGGESVRRLFETESPLGRARWAIPHEIDPLEMQRYTQALMHHRPYRDVEYRSIGLNGVSIWIAISGDPRFDRHGRFCGYRGIARDVTLHRLAYSAAEQAEARARQMVEHLPDALLLHDGHLIVYANRAAAALFGFDEPGELVGRDFFMLFAPAWRVPVRERAHRLLSGEADQQSPLERQVIRRDGTELEVRASGSVIPFRGRRHVLAVLRDISRDKALERERALAERQFRWLFERASVPLAMLTPTGRVHDANDAFCSAFGRSLARLVGNDIKPLWQDTAAERLDAALEAMERNSGLQFSFEFQTRSETASPRQMAVRLFGIPEPDAPHLRLVILLAIDITRVYEAEAAMLRTNAELEERVAERTLELSRSVRELESFTYTVSHDLRAPLRAIDGFSALLAEQLSEGELGESQRLLQRIRGNAQHMADLVDDLLQFARTSRQPLSCVWVDTAALVRDVLAALPVECLHHAQIDLQPLGRCYADPRLLALVFSNLLDNALKYSSLRPDPVIHIGQRTHADGIEFFVRDNGVGFDPRYAHRLFRVFERLHTAERFPGTGVGLATCQRIIERHGGTIRAESVPDQGATFMFRLPWPAADDPADTGGDSA